MVLSTSRFHRKGPGPSLGVSSFLSHTLEHHKGTAPSSTFSCLLSAIRRSRLTSSPWHISCFPVCDQRNPRSHHWPSPALGRDGVSRSCPTPSHCIHTQSDPEEWVSLKRLSSVPIAALVLGEADEEMATPARRLARGSRWARSRDLADSHPLTLWVPWIRIQRP